MQNNYLTLHLTGTQNRLFTIDVNLLSQRYLRILRKYIRRMGKYANSSPSQMVGVQC